MTIATPAALPPVLPLAIPPKAVIFDCDGVIVDSEPPLFAELQKDLAGRGLNLSQHELHERFVGGSVPGIGVAARKMGADIPDDWATVFYERVYQVLAEHAPLVPGILDVLNALDARGIPYAIGSNGAPRKMQITLGQHPGLSARFKGLLSGQAIGAPKPAPDLYLAAAKLLNTPPDDCVVIEDSGTGARAAKAAGIRCYGYAPEGDGARLLAENAILFRDMRDLPRLLGLAG